MKVSNLWSASPVAAKLLAGLSLCCLPTANSHAQIVGGTTTATSFRGEAAAVSGTALNSALSIANTGALAEAGGAQEASALVEQNLSFALQLADYVYPISLLVLPLERPTFSGG